MFQRRIRAKAGWRRNIRGRGTAWFDGRGWVTGEFDDYFKSEFVSKFKSNQSEWDLRDALDIPIWRSDI
jgi:hypothetical protein